MAIEWEIRLPIPIINMKNNKYNAKKYCLCSKCSKQQWKYSKCSLVFCDHSTFEFIPINNNGASVTHCSFGYICESIR